MNRGRCHPRGGSFRGRPRRGLDGGHHGLPPSGPRAMRMEEEDHQPPPPHPSVDVNMDEAVPESPVKGDALEANTKGLSFEVAVMGSLQTICNQITESEEANLVAVTWIKEMLGGI